MNFKHFFIFFFPLLIACGEGKISIDNINYEPKIVIRALVFPNQPVSGVIISRNLPIREQQVTVENLIISDALVVITGITTNAKDTLQYDLATMSYHDPESTFSVAFDGTYKLDVSATIEGKLLHASSTTTVPSQGFKILSSVDSLYYREKGERDSIKSFRIRFDRSVNVENYLMSINALDADTSTFVYSPINPYSQFKPNDVLKNMSDLKYGYWNSSLLQNTPGQSEISVLWFLLPFYGKYQTIIYATDKNYSDFVNTFDEVQDIDGNYDEPVFHIDGDGIGVFGSAIADTVYFKVLRP